MTFKKLFPSWDSANFKANLGKPAFYFYLVVPTLFLAFGGLLIWMALAGDSKLSSRIYSFAFGAAFFKASEAALRFRMKSKNWPAIVFGALCTISAIGVAVGGRDSDDFYFLVTAASLGPILVIWGLYAWRTVEWTDHKES